MNYLVLDVETTTKNNGHAFTPENKLCIVSYATPTESGYLKIEYDYEPYAEALRQLSSFIRSADLLIGFNFKFDLHWLRRYGMEFGGKRVWDCQLVQFMLDHQRTPLPSLDDSCKSFGLSGKHGDLIRDYWDRGIDTPDIPLNELTDYAINDAEITRELFLRQYERVREVGESFNSLVALHNADLLVTQEMEWNGLLLDIAKCLEEADKIKTEVQSIDRDLNSFFGCDFLNYDSPKQLSTILFGGKLQREIREQVGVYKSGAKIGLPRYAVRKEVHEFQGVVKPLKGTELDSGGWSTAEDHLRSLQPRSKATRAALDLLLRRSKLEKLRGTYYEGLPNLLSTMGWQGGFLHGQINHVIARTGRTSSSKPNLQNLPPEIDRLFRSRFGDNGLVVAFDAKGLEWVAIVYLSQDPVGIEEVNAGVDQHEMNRERFGLPEKRVAKYFVFRLIYGGQAGTFTKDPDFYWVSEDEAFWQDVMDKFYGKYTGIGKIHKVWYKNAIENGKYTTPSGRSFIFTPKDGSWEWVRPVILNYPVQSFGADLMAIARVSLFKRMKALNLKSKLVNTVHDSIVLDIFKEEWYTISTLVNEVFADIPKNFEKLFGKPFNLPMKAEAKRLDGEEIII